MAGWVSRSMDGWRGGSPKDQCEKIDKKQSPPLPFYAMPKCATRCQPNPRKPPQRTHWHFFRTKSDSFVAYFDNSVFVAPRIYTALISPPWTPLAFITQLPLPADGKPGKPDRAVCGIKDDLLTSQGSGWSMEKVGEGVLGFPGNDQHPCQLQLLSPWNSYPHPTFLMSAGAPALSRCQRNSWEKEKRKRQQFSLCKPELTLQPSNGLESDFPGDAMSPGRTLA